ncbi:Helix-turn-helix [Anaerovirgula multivorans]|uniref:Helix-turn-helix n=1 Tax=Anaerovirgula multivorans TaxID=312168 RepID=A0A239AL60_9FIRM|nr:helix-turn-helix transcriptional regulator [Anaerovirgula multivorans]SNR96072.1 Helix-turn-helix [Anaerovirgula multivorans]
MTIGQAIKQVRVEKGYRLEDIAVMTNLDTSTISRIESRDRVDLDKVVSIAEVLGSNEPLKAACQNCPVAKQLYDCDCLSNKKLLN